MSACRSPVLSAVTSRSTTSSCSERTTRTRGRRADTCVFGPMRDLPNRRRGLADGIRDLVVRHIEDFAQHEDSSLGRSQRLEHGEHRDREAVCQLDVFGDIGTGQQRFGQPLADVVLSPPRHRAQVVERLPRHDANQIGAGVADLA